MRTEEGVSKGHLFCFPHPDSYRERISADISCFHLLPTAIGMREINRHDLNPNA